VDSALSTVRLVAEELVERGASAVVLAGSHARGDAGPESDLDVIVVGPEDFSCNLERREGLLVSMSERPFEKHREAFGDPSSVCSAVPGWREALVVYDPDGLRPR
jgi:predicted nucleotidyltransferase